MPVKHCRGLSLLEILVAVGVVMILVSLLLPVIANARQEAYRTRSLTNLRQIYLGLMLYREDADAKADFGAAIDMGLPEALMSSEVYLKVVPSKQVWRSPCCCHKDSSSGHPDYVRYKTDYWEAFHTQDTWATYSTKWLGDAVLVGDYHCNERDLDLYSPWAPVRGLGVRLSGKAETRNRQIRIADLEAFWNF